MHLQFKLNKSIEEVFESLSNADNFVKVHPIIYLMKPLGNGSYLVHEKLKIAFINMYFTYPCTIESNINEHTITMKAVVKKMIQIEIVFKLTFTNGQTLVDEFTSFKSLLPVAFVMGKIFKTQHQKLFQNIENS